MNRAATALLGLLLAPPLAALDGKWTPSQLLALDAEELRQMGLAVPPARLWDGAGGGLLSATVQLGGCTGGFVSSSGLFATNHHCAYAALQQASTPDRDLIGGGFLAPSRTAEIRALGVRATLPRQSTDVTAQVTAAVPTGADDLVRFRAIEQKGKELVAACEKQPDRRCQLATFDGGLRYVLTEGIEYPDVRLVFAPPASVGEYGGDVDNWSWPRHTGDFALLRVYTAPGGKPAPYDAANLPLASPTFFRLSTAGVAPGDFVLLTGYPGITFRSMTLAEMRERAQLFFPRRAELYRVWVEILERESAGDPKARLALADRIKGRANQEKNARGQVAGLARGRILEKKEAEEREVLAWAARTPAHQEAVAAYRELAELAEERLATWERDFLLQQASPFVRPLDMASTLVRWADEKAKPDLERLPAYMERNRGRLEEGLRRDQGRIHLPAEAAVLADFLTRFAALPAGARSPAFDTLAGGESTLPAFLAKATALLGSTRVTDLDELLRMFNETREQLAARRDPLLDFAFALDRERREIEERQHRFEGAVSRLRPVFRRAVEARAGRPVAPDGNGTLRVSLAHVQGYRPRDGVLYEPQTTVAGMVAKHTGEAPFQASEVLRQKAADAPRSRFADPRLGDVPLAFLADGDTSSGSSGSPVLNGRGELVGLNFDRVFENVANDFGFNPEVARSIAVDVRYLLWVMEALHGAAAGPLFAEMGVTEQAGGGR